MNGISEDRWLRALWSEMPTLFKVVFIGQFVVYVAIAWVAWHFISKLW